MQLPRGPKGRFSSQCMEGRQQEISVLLADQIVRVEKEYQLLEISYRKDLIQPAAPTFTGNKNGDEEENEAESS
jgi:hypothetical protein